MRKLKEVLRLHSLGLSQHQIARGCSISQSTVHEYLAAARMAGVKWPLPEDWGDEQIEQALFARRTAPAVWRKHPEPDWAKIHQELQTRKDLTLQLIWHESRQNDPEGYGYSRFCDLYRRWLNKLDLVLRQEHRAGEKMFVDYAGATIAVHDAASGEVRPAAIFVAVLGASSYTFAEATSSQDLPNWIGSHIRALEYFQGVPEVVVPDNLKSAVTRPSYYEPEINRTYRALAEHYGTVIIPARPRRARDKTYASYCSSFRRCDFEGRLFGAAAALTLYNSAWIKRFVKATLEIIVAVLHNMTLSGPKVDRRGCHAMPLAHFLGGQQTTRPEPTIAGLQAECLADVGDFFQVEGLVLPGTPALPIQNIGHFAVGVPLQQ